MNFFGLSPGEIILIMLVAMIVLGPEKLPETAASIGKWIREFRRATQELTQQFADENPFTEIQRALNLTEGLDPISFGPNAPVAATASETTVAQTDESALTTVATPTAVTTFPSAAPSAVPPRSDYFDRPVLYQPIEDRWAHGTLEEFSDRVFRRIKPQIEAAIAEEWTHGVPVIVPPVVAEVPTVDDQVTTTDTVSDESSDAERSLPVAPTMGIANPLALADSPEEQPKTESSDEAMIRSILQVAAELEASREAATTSDPNIAESHLAPAGESLRPSVDLLEQHVTPAAQNGTNAKPAKPRRKGPVPVGSAASTAALDDRGHE